MQAQDIMTTAVVSIGPTSGIRQAVQLMLEKKISGIPVVEDTGIVCGMLTEGDLLRRKEIGGAAGGQGDGHQTAADLRRYILSRGWSVGDLMSRNVVTVTRDMPIDRIADLMLSHHIKRVPVVDDGRLVGIVSRRDLLHAIIDASPDTIAAGDEALRLAVSARLQTDLGLGRDKVAVAVEGAQVTITGNLDSELQRKAVRVLVEGVQGVSGFADKTTI